MALGHQQTRDLVKKYAQHTSDTASPQVQVALLTTRINALTEHFKVHTKDQHSKRGLMKAVGQRRRLLNYLGRKDAKSYKTLITDLGIRK